MSPIPGPVNQTTQTMRLIRSTAASWTKEREAEARERGYRIEYRHERGMLIASFFNGPFHCYDREHVL